MGKEPVQVIDARHRDTAESNDNIPHVESGLPRRTIRLDLYHAYAALNREIIKSHNAPMNRNILSSDADVAPPHPALLDQGRRDELCRINGDGKTQALRRHDHCRIHTDHLSP